MNYYNVIKGPVNTEKSNLQKEMYNQVSFIVDRNANRIEIGKAVEALFKARVASVKTMQVKGKVKRRGRILGKRKNWKKAIVTLMPGERIDFFDGV